MTKKIIRVKVGDVFRIKDTNPKKYLQFVYIDDEALGSDVVVVYEDNPENYDFYMHTFVMEGVQDGLWERVDHKNVTVDLSTFAFKTYSEPSIWWERPFWYYWTCDGSDASKLGMRHGAKKEAVDGGAYPAADVIYRIEHGKSEFVSNWPS